jgi:hypothetical protein
MNTAKQSSHLHGLSIRGQDILYKFFVANRSVVPEGLREVSTTADKARDQKNADIAKSEGNGKLAVEGRVRPGRVDTGKAIYQNVERVKIASVRSLLARKGYRLTDAHFYQKIGQESCVIVLNLSTKGEAVKLSRKTMDALRAMSRDLSWKTNVWDNGDERPSTVNFTNSSSRQPGQMLVVRDDFLRLVDLDGFDPVSFEADEDRRVAEELLEELAVS